MANIKTSLTLAELILPDHAPIAREKQRQDMPTIAPEIVSPWQPCKAGYAGD